MGSRFLVLLLVAAFFGSLCSCSAESAVELGAPTGTIKTIKDVEFGVPIDCVDIYQQPSLRHPLLRNHTIRMKPSSSSSFPVRKEEGKSKGVLPARQDWSKHEQCPKGTIPIIRTQKRPAPITVEEAAAIIVNRNPKEVDSRRGLEMAQIFKTGEKYTGVHAQLNVWKPAVEEGGQSTARIWLMASDDQSDDVDIISAGWMVDPNWVFPNRTVPIIFWTSSKRRHLGGCYNLQCEGFVQVDCTFHLGRPFNAISTYGGRQFETEFSIEKDHETGDWWFRMMNIKLGYWPSSLFTALSKSADIVSWGGHVTSESAAFGTPHTKTQMGSGHFPEEGFGKSCFFRDLWYTTIDNPNRHKSVYYGRVPHCYDVLVAEDEEWGVHFFFGGPGYSKQCRSN